MKTASIYDILSVPKYSSPSIILRGFRETHLDFVAEALGRKESKKVEIKVYNSLGDWAEDSNGSKQSIKKGKKFKASLLAELGYERVRRVWNKNEYSVLGDTILFYPSSSKYVIRVSLLGDEVESIELVDTSSRQKVSEIDEVELGASEYGADKVVWGNESSSDFGKTQFVFVRNLLEESMIPSESEVVEVDIKQIPGVANYSTIPILKKVLGEYERNGYEIMASVRDEKYVGELGMKVEVVGEDPFLKRGFVSDASKVVVLTEYELLGEFDLIEHDTDHSKVDLGDIFKRIVPGDYIVHEDHGIGVFNSVSEQGDKIYLDIHYAKKDRLLVPVTQSNKVTKYIGSGKKSPTLTGLNSGSWGRVKGRVRKAAEKIARQLVQLYAMRSLAKAPAIMQSDDEASELRDFIHAFEHQDTEDQTVITQEILDDLVSGKPMDRLLVGDVGFGKTEVGIRAAYAVANGGYQVAILAPTTILVEQHLAVLRERLKDSPVRVAALSRFISKADKTVILKELEDGKIDIIVGTHALLSDAVKFKDLGLLIVDEEQKFGVKQKEKIKEKRLDVHVLSMTATPIPRTLNMALAGIRDISVLASAPPGRVPIKNVTDKFSWEIVEKAINDELGRGGQIYLLHNKVRDIEVMAGEVRKRFPDIEVGVLHGQMGEAELARVMNSFTKGEVDVLVCTTIIENGLDISNVNTLIIDEASMYGLSQLYQIRGRVGRGDRQAHAYFLYKSLKGDASERLHAIMESSNLGSGFLLSNRDLEIRGAGNILGKSQSGTIDSVGYALFSKVLQQEVDKLKEK